MKQLFGGAADEKRQSQWSVLRPQDGELEGLEARSLSQQLFGGGADEKRQSQWSVLRPQDGELEGRSLSNKK